MTASLLGTESTQSFIDKVIELAGANGLPSKGVESSLSAFSAESLRNHLNKVCWSFSYISIPKTYVLVREYYTFVLLTAVDQNCLKCNF